MAGKEADADYAEFSLLKEKSTPSPQTVTQDSDMCPPLPANTQPIPILLALRLLTSILSVTRGCDDTGNQRSDKVIQRTLKINPKNPTFL